jgi:hypothetical protein
VTLRFHNARRVGSAPGFALWQPSGDPRLALFFLNRYDDGWLGDRGSINLWPRPGTTRLEGVLRVSVESPPPLGDARITFQLPGGRVHTFRAPARSTIDVTVPVCSPGPWTADFRSEVRGFVGDRGVSVKSSVPQFIPGRGGCSGKPAAATVRIPRQTA